MKNFEIQGAQVDTPTTISSCHGPFAQMAGQQEFCPPSRAMWCNPFYADRAQSRGMFISQEVSSGLNDLACWPQSAQEGLHPQGNFLLVPSAPGAAGRAPLAMSASERQLPVDDGQFATLGSRRAYSIGQWLIGNYETAEGLSVSRQSVYKHYEEACRRIHQEPINNATFGKLIRAVFPNLKTRRLGTRGNSKYHYYGIRLRETPKGDSGYPPGQAGPAQHESQPVRDSQSSARQRGDSNHPSPRQQPDRSLMPNVRQTPLLPVQAVPSEQFMSPLMMSVPLKTANPSLVPHDTDLGQVNRLLSEYQRHCVTLIDLASRHAVDDVSAAMNGFWKAGSKQYQKVLSCDHVVDCIRDYDRTCYKAIVKTLVPDCFQTWPKGLATDLRKFARQMEGIVLDSVENITSTALTMARLTEARIFARSLLRHTSLNHLATAAKGVLSPSESAVQMAEDWCKMDYAAVVKQAEGLKLCDGNLLRSVGHDIKTMLQNGTGVEGWVQWGRQMVENIVFKPKGTEDQIARRARQLQMRWSLVASLVMRDLTLRSSRSFGAFYLLRLLLDDIRAMALEERIPATSKKTTERAAPGSDLPSLAYLTLPSHPTMEPSPPHRPALMPQSTNSCAELHEREKWTNIRTSPMLVATKREAMLSPPMATQLVKRPKRAVQDLLADTLSATAKCS